MRTRNYSVALIACLASCQSTGGESARYEWSPSTSFAESSVPAEYSQASPATVALPESSTAEASDDEWRFVVTPYAWLLAVDGVIEVDDSAATVNEDFGDILDALSFVLQGRFEAWKGPWGVLLDLNYSQLETEAHVGSVKIDNETDMFLGMAGGLYRFVDQETAEDGSGGVKVDGIFGVGYTSLDAKLDFNGVAPDRSSSADWIDPIVGLRSRWHFSEKWSGMIEGMIGGFELFDGSELYTMFTVGAGRNFGTGKTLLFGWRNLDIDYDGGSSIEADLRFSGPFIGFSWAF